VTLSTNQSLINDNTTPHIARTVREFREQEVIDTFQWPVMFPDMNPIEHIWNSIDRNVNQRKPQCQIIAELTKAIVEE
jgi:hypothetical protein